MTEAEQLELDTANVSLDIFTKAIASLDVFTRNRVSAAIMRETLNFVTPPSTCACPQPTREK